MAMTFKDRNEAGQKLAEKLVAYQGKQAIVLSVPRGGVVVGREIANRLKLPLDVIVAKKIGAPENPELGIGAIGPGGEIVVDQELAERVGATPEYLKTMAAKLASEVLRRASLFRQGKEALNLDKKIVILVDDGVATGATIKAAIGIVRQGNPQKIVVGVPVISRETLPEIEKLSDEVVYLESPELFFAVGQFYQEFDQVSDEEVIGLLK